MREEVHEDVSQQVSVVYQDGTEGIRDLPDGMRQIASQVQSWLNGQRAVAGRVVQPKFTEYDTIFDEMRLARKAMEHDDVVSNFAEITEGLGLQGTKWESSDWVTQDIFNQMAADQNLDSVVRKMFREDFAMSQSVLAAWWGYGEFSVRGETESGNKRKAKKRVYYPQRLTLLDPTRVVPVGTLAFGLERLAWKATPEEMSAYRAMVLGQLQDDVMDRFYVGEYKISAAEQKELGALPDLLLLSEEAVTRHTATRADFERWAPVRLKSIFPILAMKQHLADADRVALIGAANYILLVKKGDKDNPAHPEEIQNLKEGFKTLARVPVIFSDHRLAIEIVAPKQDYTLQAEKYDLLDGRIMQRLINGLPTTSGNSAKASVHLDRTVSRALENRRHMLKRFLEKTIARAVVEHPKNKDIFTEGPPSMTFFPANVMIDSDATLAQQIISMRTMNEISRETALEYFGFDQAAEAMRRSLEEKKYDDIFQTAVPFSAPGQGGQGGQGKPPAAQGPAGAQGGRPTGGGKTSANPTKTQRTDNGTTAPKRSGS